MEFIQKIKWWIYNGIWFVLVLWLTWIAYWAYTTMTDVTTWQALTATLFNQVQENVRVLKTTVDWLSNVPTWAVMAFNLASCPSWWITADGTSWTPDLRWTFIRWINWNVNSRDVSRTLWDYQVDDFKAHKHTEAYSSQINAGWAYVGAWGSSGVSSTSYSLSQTTAAVGPNQYVSTTGGTETRPKNVALLYCVKQ